MTPRAGFFRLLACGAPQSAARRALLNEFPLILALFRDQKDVRLLNVRPLGLAESVAGYSAYSPPPTWADLLEIRIRLLLVVWHASEGALQQTINALRFPWR